MLHEGKPLLERIITLLVSNSVHYQLYEHIAVYTSEDAAQVRGTNLSEGAKALVFSADKRPILLVIPGNRRVNAKEFKRRFNIKDLRLVSAEELQNLTGLEAGAIPPFGNLMGFDTFLDNAVATGPYIAFNAGSHTTSIRMAVKDYIALVKPQTASFSQ